MRTVGRIISSSEGEYICGGRASEEPILHLQFHQCLISIVSQQMKYSIDSYLGLHENTIKSDYQ